MQGYVYTTRGGAYTDNNNKKKHAHTMGYIYTITPLFFDSFRSTDRLYSISALMETHITRRLPYPKYAQLHPRRPKAKDHPRGLRQDGS